VVGLVGLIGVVGSVGSVGVANQKAGSSRSSMDVAKSSARVDISASQGTGVRANTNVQPRPTKTSCG